MHTLIVCYPGEETDTTATEIADTEESLEIESSEDVLSGRRDSNHRSTALRQFH